ncbi:hypothetical protein H0H92_001426 [Tricholoma furcatifolium]|nr:hypothetical protein H0H92_001426 [Tricholoma furcatifolium]
MFGAKAAIFATACFSLVAAAPQGRQELAQSGSPFYNCPRYDVSKALKAANATGTFFFNGDNYACIYDADEMKRVKYAYNHGHQIASHTWSHPDLTTLTWDETYGNYNDLVRQVSAARGQKLVIWDFDSGDSVGATPTESEDDYEELIEERPSTILALNHETIGQLLFLSSPSPDQAKQ